MSKISLICLLSTHSQNMWLLLLITNQYDLSFFKIQVCPVVLKSRTWLPTGAATGRKSCAHSPCSVSPVHTHPSPWALCTLTLFHESCAHSPFFMSSVHTHPALWALCTLTLFHESCAHSPFSMSPVHTRPALWAPCTLPFSVLLSRLIYQGREHQRRLYNRNRSI